MYLQVICYYNTGVRQIILNKCHDLTDDHMLSFRLKVKRHYKGIVLLYYCIMIFVCSSHLSLILELDKIIWNISHDFTNNDMLSFWVKLKPMWMYCITVLVGYSFIWPKINVYNMIEWMYLLQYTYLHQLTPSKHDDQLPNQVQFYHPVIRKRHSTTQYWE